MREIIEESKRSVDTDPADYMPRVEKPHPGLKNILEFNEKRARKKQVEEARKQIEEQDREIKPPSDLAA